MKMADLKVGKVYKKVGSERSDDPNIGVVFSADEISNGRVEGGVLYDDKDRSWWKTFACNLTDDYEEVPEEEVVIYKVVKER